jgi:hypothetical protein
MLKVESCVFFDPPQVHGRDSVETDICIAGEPASSSNVVEDLDGGIC